MKKIFLMALFLSASFGAFAQFEIGLKVTPNIGWNRVESTKSFPLESDGARLHIGGGIVMDYFFGDNYAISTGLQLTTKGGTYKGGTESTDIMVQYVELPISLKLFTNEVAPSTRVYFQVGGEIGALTSAKVDDEKTFEDLSGNNVKWTKSFNTLELGVLLGAGVEYQLGENTKVFGGLIYNHGLTNIEDKDFAGIDDLGDEFTMKNSLIGLDLGLKF